MLIDSHSFFGISVCHLLFLVIEISSSSSSYETSTEKCTAFMTCLISALCWVWSAISMALIRSLSLLQKPTNVTVSITRQRSLLFPTTYPVFTGCRAVTECTKKHGKRQPEYCGIHGNDAEECIYSVQALRTTDNVNVTLKGHIQYTKTFNNTVIWYDATPTQKLSVRKTASTATCSCSQKIS